jgi:hypothetical protein
MLLPVALIALFLTGCWFYSLTDALLTPSVAFRGWSKPVWVSLIAVTLVFGATAWLVARYRHHTYRRRRAGRSTIRWTATDDAVARHPAGRSRGTGHNVPRGPDDDPGFLEELDRLIRGSADTGDDRP